MSTYWVARDGRIGPENPQAFWANGRIVITTDCDAQVFPGTPRVVLTKQGARNLQSVLRQMIPCPKKKVRRP